MKKSEEEIQVLQSQIELHGENEEVLRQIEATKAEMQISIDREEMHIKQKARVAWLKEGNRNSK